jgi:serine/threonine protein kinase
MPFVEGESLRERLKREGPLSTPEALRIACHVADALAYAHSKQTIHRDIKPANILLSDGHAIVADFGIARAIHVAGGDALTEPGSALGTPAYMSPEQILGEQEIDGRSDIYSLGCVLFEMLTGHVPFSTNDGHVVVARRFTSPPPRVRETRADVSNELENIVATMLARDPAERFRTGRELAEVLEAAGRSHSPARDRGSHPRTSSSPSAAPGNLGAFVSRTCNRWRQVNAFEASLRSARESFPGKAQFYVVHGDEGQAHESFVERLVATRISHFATEIAGEDRGTVASVKIPWPDDDDIELCRRDLTISLFREIAPTYMGTDLSVAALSNLAAASLSSVVVIQHDIRASRWGTTTERLINWYVRTFWSALKPARRATIFLVFFKLVYSITRQHSPLAGWFRRGRVSKKQVQERLQGIFAASGLECPATILSELGSVTIDDVESWFSQNGIYHSEQRRRDLAAGIFRGAAIKPLAEVEVSLERIHREFVRQAMNGRRELA